MDAVGEKTVFASADLSRRRKRPLPASIGSRLVDMCLAILPIGERTAANLASSVRCIPALFDTSSVGLCFTNPTGTQVFHDYSSERLLNAPLLYGQVSPAGPSCWP
jgi:hypothetical protein